MILVENSIPEATSPNFLLNPYKATHITWRVR